MGRFNYVYTTKEQHHLGEDAILGDGAKTLLSDTAILKEGVNKMSVKSSIETFYEPDTRVTPVMRDGTLYIPEDALHEILDYGTSKSIYDGATDTFTLSKFTMERSGYTYEVTGKTTLVTTLGALSAYRDGSLITLSHPVTVIDGLISVPVSLLSDVFGYSVTSRKVGNRTIVVIDKDGAAPDGATVDTVLTYLE